MLVVVKPDDMFRYILVAGLFMLMSIGVVFRLKARTGEPLDRRQEGWFILLGLRFSALAGFAGMAAYLIRPAYLDFSTVPLPVWVRWLGVGLGCITGGLLLWTLQNLGKNLTDTVVTRKQHTLVTTGPYRWIRHPFYVCASLIVLTTSLVAANAFFLVSGGLVLLLLAFRTRIEERHLLNRFGGEYQNYMDRTGRFFPRLPLP